MLTTTYDQKTAVGLLQEWLLAQQRCTGCGRILRVGRQEKRNGNILVTCSCQRVFVYWPERGSYRRASLEEAI